MQEISGDSLDGTWRGGSKHGWNFILVAISCHSFSLQFLISTELDYFKILFHHTYLKLLFTALEWVVSSWIQRQLENKLIRKFHDQKSVHPWRIYWTCHGKWPGSWGMFRGHTRSCNTVDFPSFSINLLVQSIFVNFIPALYENNYNIIDIVHFVWHIFGI